MAEGLDTCSRCVQSRSGTHLLDSRDMETEGTCDKHCARLSLELSRTLGHSSDLTIVFKHLSFHFQKLWLSQCVHWQVVSSCWSGRRHSGWIIQPSGGQWVAQRGRTWGIRMGGHLPGILKQTFHWSTFFYDFHQGSCSSLSALLVLSNFQNTRIQVGTGEIPQTQGWYCGAIN